MEISLHSNKKHIALGYYLKIVKDLIASKRMPFKVLYYADLYCGDGRCVCEETGKEYDPPLIQSLLRPAKMNNIPVFCFLNDINPHNMEAIKARTEEYKKFVVDYGTKDANEYYKEVLEKIPKDQFSIFFLDPFNHTQLKWTTIKEISKHIHQYGKSIRRPELIINLMTYTMLGSYMAKSFDSINEALGTNEWLAEVEKNKKAGISAPVEKALVDVFIRQLKKLGYMVPTPIQITNTVPPNTVYYLIWATNESGYKVIETRIIPWLNKLMAKTQKQNVTERIRADSRKRGILPLSAYTNN